MPRTARRQSETGIYHTILRGVNKQQIFECNEDYERIKAILKEQTIQRTDLMSSAIKPRCVIYAYCLMGNHMHLLIKECGESISEVMKRISSAYAYYYNNKYGRIGHLFQERFKSQPVSDWEYFLTLLRYIHQNPLKAHLVDNINDYRWSSWYEYIGKEHNCFCATKTILDRISINDLSEITAVILTGDDISDYIDLERVSTRPHIADNEVWEIIRELCDATCSSDFQRLSRSTQVYCLQNAYKRGAGPRALSRLTGISYSVVQRCLGQMGQGTGT